MFSQRGGGKTVVVIGPCLYEEGVTVCVSPLRALLRETDMRLKNAGIQTSRVEDMNVDGEGLGRVLLASPTQGRRTCVLRLIVLTSLREVRSSSG